MSYTDEQVEAAAKVLWERHALNGEWDAGSDTGRDECRDDARAALEAAAGVAPQTPSEPWVEAVNRALYRYDNDESFGVREVASALAAPVKPSSTVDDTANALIAAIADELTPGRRDADLILAARKLRKKVESSTVDEEEIAEVIHLSNHKDCQNVIPTQDEKSVAKAVADHLRAAGCR